MFLSWYLLGSDIDNNLRVVNSYVEAYTKINFVHETLWHQK